MPFYFIQYKFPLNADLQNHWSAAENRQQPSAEALKTETKIYTTTSKSLEAEDICDFQSHSRLLGHNKNLFMQLYYFLRIGKGIHKKRLDAADEILNFAHSVITIVIISHPFELLTLWVCLNLENTIPICRALTLTRSQRTCMYKFVTFGTDHFSIRFHNSSNHPRTQSQLISLLPSYIYIYM